MPDCGIKAGDENIGSFPVETVETSKAELQGRRQYWQSLFQRGIREIS